MLLLDVGTVSVDKTRLQSNNWSFPHVIVGCWHSIRRQDAAAIKQLELSSCYCWMLAQHRRQDAAAIKQLKFSSCYCWMLARYP